MPTFRDDLHLGHSVPMVDTEDIVDGAITEPKLADDSVSTRTIQDGAVTEPKIAEKAITEPKLADAAVSTRTIKFRAVTESKIGDSAVSTRTIQNGAVTNPKIANGAVSMNKLDNETKTLIQRGADSSWTPMGDYDVDAIYYANDLVFDPETNSSYLSLRADNMGHAVTDEMWWMKVLDGSYEKEAAEIIEAAVAEVQELTEESVETIQSLVDNLPVAQVTGQSTTSAMSQKAVTDEIMTPPQSWDLSYGGDFTWELGTIHDDGKAYSSSSYYHLYIPVSDMKGWKVKLKSKSTIATSYAFLKGIGFEYTSTTPHPTPFYCAGYNNKINIPAGQEAMFTIPNDCNYIYINCGQTSGSNNTSPESNSYYSPQWQDIDARTSFNTTAIDGIISGEGYEVVDFDWIDDYYVSTNGILNSTNAFKVSGALIPIPEEYDAILTKLFNGTSVAGIVFYDENRAVVDGFVRNISTSVGYWNVEISIPSNVKYLRLNAYKNETRYGVQTLRFIKRETTPKVVLPLSFFVNNPVRGWWSAANVAFNPNYNTITNKVFITTNIDIKVISKDIYRFRLIGLNANKNGLVFFNEEGGIANITPEKYLAKRVKGGYSWNIQIDKSGADITENINDVLATFDVEISLDDYIAYTNKYVLANPYFETFASINQDATLISKETIFGTSIDGCGGALRRIPAVVVSNNNYVIAATEVRSAYADNSQTGVVIARKALSGDTWQYNNILPYNASTYGKVMNPSFVVDRTGAHGTAGRIFLFFIAFPITSSNNGYAMKASTAEMDCAYIYSDDDGATWSSIVSIKSAWDTTEWTWVGVAPANGCQMQDGTLAIPCAGIFANALYSAMLVKTTNGSWTFSKKSANQGDNESCAFANVNTLYLNCRNEQYGNKRNLYRYEFNSNELTEVCYPYNPNVICQQSISQGTINGNLVYLQSANDPTTYNVRNRLTLFASNDGFKWLRVARLNDATTYGYSVVDVYNGKVVIVYENSGTISYINLTPIASIIDATYGVASLNDEDRMQKIVERLL